MWGIYQKLVVHYVMVASVNAAFPGQTLLALPTRTVLVLLSLTLSFGLASEPAYFDYDAPPTHAPTQATTTPSDLAPGTDGHKARHSKGKYTVREEVVRRMEATHPCQLTRTAVKVSFPDLKNEVLVSFIGYKEPNLMFVDRCKGLCNADAGSRMACVPTRRSWRTVNMQMKTQMLGTGEVRERARELVLEEHEACACQCVTITPAHCHKPELFNNSTCACACDTHSAFRVDKLQCEAQQNRHWDDATCACRSNDDDSAVGPPGDAHEGYGCADCLHCLGVAAGDHASKSEAADAAAAAAKGWLAAVACGALAVFFAVTTAYYWRRSRRMEAELLAEEDDYHYQNTAPVDGSMTRGGANADKAESGVRPVNGVAGASKLRLPLASVALPMPSGDDPTEESSSHHRKRHHRHKRRRRADGLNEESEQDRIRRQNIEESLAPNFLDQIASPSGSLKFDC